MVKLYTRKGDKGKTQLLYGGRISKTDLRCETYGTLDEANSALGLARALSHDSYVQQLIKQIQTELFTVGAELATDPNYYDKFLSHFSPVTTQMVEQLESLLDQMEETVRLPRSFILPGASAASAAIDLSRTILRRAERRTVQLDEAGLLYNPTITAYLNRLSDLLFMLARYEDRTIPFEKLTRDPV